MGAYPRDTGSNPVEGNWWALFSLIPSALYFIFLWHTNTHTQTHTQTHTHTHKHTHTQNEPVAFLLLSVSWFFRTREMEAIKRTEKRRQMQREGSFHFHFESTFKCSKLLFGQIYIVFCQNCFCFLTKIYLSPCVRLGITHCSNSHVGLLTLLVASTLAITAYLWWTL